MTEKKEETTKGKEKEKKNRGEIEMTVGEGEDILTNRWLDKLLQRSLPFKFKYWLQRIIKKLRKELEEYFEEKKSLIEKHVVLKDDGDPKTAVKEGIHQFVFKSEKDDKEFRKKIEALREDKLKLPGVFYMAVDPEDKKFDELSGHETGLIMPLIEDIEL